MRFSTQNKSFLSHPLTLLLVGVLPCIAVVSHFFHSMHVQESLKKKVHYLQRKVREKAEKTQKEKQLINRLKGANPDYVQQTLENLRFLKEEIKRTQTLLLSQPEAKNLVRRLSYLQGKSNQLRFQEKNFQRKRQLQEVELTQVHPVEMGREDLQNLLSKLEHVEIGPFSPDKESPDFIIDQFELIRKPLSKEEETLLVKLHCIKREFVHD